MYTHTSTPTIMLLKPLIDIQVMPFETHKRPPSGVDYTLKAPDQYPDHTSQLTTVPRELSEPLNTEYQTPLTYSAPGTPIYHQQKK